MRRVLPCLILALALMVGGLAKASAQAATPSPGGPATGTAVPLIGPDGTELGRLTVTGSVDPFEGYDPNAPPEHGYHFVLLTISTRNTGSRPLTFDPGQLLLQDSEGFLYNSTTVHFGAQAPPEPALTRQDLAAGAEQHGVVGFQVLNGAHLVRVLYQQANDQIVLLAALGAPSDPAIGSSISLVGTEGTELGRVSITQVVNPFQDYDPTSPPNRGQHFVLLNVSVQNRGPRTLTFDPGRLFLQDVNGFLYGTTTIQRSQQATTATPNLQRQDLAPNARATGVVGFAVLNGSALARVLYQPVNGQLVVLAGLGASAAVTPSAAASPSASPGATANCTGVAAWLSETTTHLMQAVSDSQIVANPASLTPAQLQNYAKRYGDLATTQQTMAVPPAAAKINVAVVKAFPTFSQAITHLVHGGSSGNVDEVTQGANMFNDAGHQLQTIAQEMTALASSCNISA